MEAIALCQKQQALTIPKAMTTNYFFMLKSKKLKQILGYD